MNGILLPWKGGRTVPPKLPQRSDTPSPSIFLSFKLIVSAYSISQQEMSTQQAILMCQSPLGSQCLLEGIVNG